jgi:hypothetical protein
MAKSLGSLNRDIRRKTQSAARHAAAEIMNDLAQAGPVWSGRFANSWVADAPGVGKGPDGTYPYTIRDTPKLPDTVAAVKRSPKLVIRNTVDYALQAMDLEEGTFIAIGEPKGEVVSEGTRYGGRRGEVSDDGNGGSRSTAPLDWFNTYVSGGGLGKSLGKGVKIAFARKN